MRPRLVVLDAAGTLLEVEGSVGAAYAELAREAGAKLDPPTIQAGFARAMAAASPLAFGALASTVRELAEQSWWRDVARRALEASRPLPESFDFDLFFARAWQFFAEPEAWRVPEDVRPGLRALRRAGHPLAVFSNWDGRLEPLLDRLGLAGYFARILFSSALPAAKPDPAAYRAAREALVGLAAELPPLMVGDRLDHDIEPALAAGWGAVWLDREGGAKRAPKAAGRITNLRDLASHPAIAVHAAAQREAL